MHRVGPRRPRHAAGLQIVGLRRGEQLDREDDLGVGR